LSVISSDSTSDIGSSSLTARIVIANQEAEDLVRNLKTRIQKVEDDAKRLGLEADTRGLQQALDGTLEEFALARTRLEWEDAKLRSVSERSIAADGMKRSADEAAVARQTLHNIMTLGTIMGFIADKILQKVLAGNIEIPDMVSPKLLASLAHSADRLTSATETAIKIEHGRAGEPEAVLGVQIGVLLDGCSDEELVHVKMTGQLPRRLRTRILDA
jgi:hypothetical protein